MIKYLIDFRVSLCVNDSQSSRTIVRSFVCLFGLKCLYFAYLAVTSNRWKFIRKCHRFTKHGRFTIVNYLYRCARWKLINCSLSHSLSLSLSSFSLCSPANGHISHHDAYDDAFCFCHFHSWWLHRHWCVMFSHQFYIKQWI